VSWKQKYAIYHSAIPESISNIPALSTEQVDLPIYPKCQIFSRCLNCIDPLVFALAPNPAQSP